MLSIKNNIIISLICDGINFIHIVKIVLIMDKVIKCQYCGEEMKCGGCDKEIKRTFNMTCNIQEGKPNHLYHQNQKCQKKYWTKREKRFKSLFGRKV